MAVDYTRVWDSDVIKSTVDRWTDNKGEGGEGRKEKGERGEGRGEEGGQGQSGCMRVL